MGILGLIILKIVFFESLIALSLYPQILSIHNYIRFSNEIFELISSKSNITCFSVFKY